MDPIVIGTIGLGAFVILFVMGMPIGFSAAIVGFMGLVILKSWAVGGDSLSFLPYSITASYPLSVIPMFIIMGYFAFFAGVTSDLFKTARRWVGHLPGGLAIATTFGCAGFAACSGSTIASAAVMGKITIPEMIESGYDQKVATGVVAASGTLSALIPPSTLIVIYGVITEQSIGTLLIAGLIPGILSAIIYATMLFFRFRFNPKLGPVLPGASPWKERLASLKGVWGVLVIMLIVLGGIYTGVFTPTEAGAVGAFGAFLMALFMRRLTWPRLKEAILETGKTTAMIFMILVGVLILLRFLALSGLSSTIVTFATTLSVPPLVLLISILIVFMFLGMFMSAVGMMMITLPLVTPIILSLGYSPLWFGIIVIKMTEMAAITPPVGVTVYAVKSVAPDVPLENIFRGIFPFLAMDILTVGLLIAFPSIILWLPQTMMNS
ncbi:TRAP transporter large permease [Chloroflexota bacterium]